MSTKDLLSKELRITITNHCNYKCIFCHNDGVSIEDKITELNDITFVLIRKFLYEGGEDITLTGGEPLLNKKSIDYTKKIIDFIRYDCKSDAHITIVTNGSNINEDLISYLKKISNFNFNFSIHSFDPNMYQKITAQDRYSLTDVYNNIEKLRNNNIRFKINYVILKDLNNHTEHIKNAIKESKRLGASSIKFIELLITDQQQNMLEKYYEAKSIVSLLEKNLTLISRTDRKSVFKYIDEELEQNIELIKCTCKVGCKNCLKYRPIAMDITGNYHPCFISEEEKIKFEDEINIEKSLKDGVDYIISLAGKYEDMSPILNNEPVLRPEKLSAYFVVNEKIHNEFITRKEEYLKIRYINHNYYLYRPVTSDEKWEKFRKTVRIRENLNNVEQSALIASENELVDKDGLILTKTKYNIGNDFLMEDKRENIERLLTNLDYRLILKYRIEGFYIIYKYLRTNISKVIIDNRPVFILALYPRHDSDFNTMNEIIKKYDIQSIRSTIFEYLWNYKISQKD